MSARGQLDLSAASAAANAAPNDARAGLAIISNGLTPYRINLHKLVAAGIPELKLHTLVTHGDADFVWTIEPPPEIHVAHFAERGETPRTGILRAPLREWRKGGRMIDYLRRNRVRAVVLNGYRYLSYLRVIEHCRRHGLPVFVRNDGNIRTERGQSAFKEFFKRRAYRWWIPRVSGIMSMGKLGDQLFMKYGANPRHLYRVPYWPDYEFFAHVDPVGLKGFHRKFGLDEGRQYIIYSGRLVHWKRVDLLIDAFASIATDRPDWDLLVVGDGRERDELQKRVPEALRLRVVWTGFLDSQESAVAYHAADVLALTSDGEAWALVIQEAMAAGLAVVSSDAAGAAYELIEDGQSGRIFSIGDLVGLKRALLDVTDAAALDGYKQRSRAALDRWRSKVDPVGEIRRALADFGVLGGVSDDSRITLADGIHHGDTEKTEVEAGH